MSVSILPLEVLSLDDVLASGRGDKNAATFDGIFDGRHLVALHRGLKSVDGVDLGDDDTASESTKRLSRALSNVTVSSDQSNLG